MGAHRFYEEGEAEEILRRALHQGSPGAIDHQRLLSMASELGISEDAVARAEAEMAAEREGKLAQEQEAQDRIEFKKYQRAKIWNNFSGYLGFAVFLIGIWWLTGHGYFWPMWPVGIGVLGFLSSFIESLLGHSDKEFERWRRKKYKQKAIPKGSNREEMEAFLDEIVPRLEGRKLMAIKDVRERFGLELREAKDVVDDYYVRHGIQ